jgi:predicted nuclease of restriction endonuclease-like (RecB) superfamily
MGNQLADYQSAINDIKKIISSGTENAYNAASKAMVQTYWSVGKRIVEQEQNGQERAEYGKALIAVLASELTKEFGKNYSERNLHYFRKFYQYFPDEQILNACVQNLNWTHFRSLLRVPDENARIWYMNEAAMEGWSSRILDRNISTQYYYRLMQSPKKEKVIAEMRKKTEGYQQNQYELIKSPIIAEFLGFKTEDSHLESDLESAILSHIRDFLMEMGRGFAFVARQQHIVTETEDYYIDLVFYNIELKCYVLIDLKMGKITHQDVGQIDMYVRMYDDLKCKSGDNPTIGILLCSETDEDIARYSILHDNDHLFMSKCLTYLPTKEQLRMEIEREKEIFRLQHPVLEDKKERKDE